MNVYIGTLMVASLSGFVTAGYSAGVTADEKTRDNQVEHPGYQGNDFYRSVGKLRGSSTCTGSFIATSDAPDAPAYVLTNGHCAIDPFDKGSANRITLDSPVSYTIDFNYFHDSQEKKIPVSIQSIAYATMKGADIAVLKTDQTIAQMKQKGLEPFRLSEAATTVGEDIVVSGVPIQVNVLQNAQCTNDRQIDVVENYWHWYGMLSNACGGISSGSSGSPVFNASRTIIGIINTTSRGAVGATCYNGNPCEVGRGGPGIVPDQNYVVPVLGVLSCFGKTGEFNLANGGCSLPRPSGIEIQNYPWIFGVKDNDAHNTWKFGTQAPDKVRVKKIKLEQSGDSCQNLMGYGPPIDASSLRPEAEMLPFNQEGVHQYCVISGNDETARNPEVIQVLIDNTPPVLKPTVDIQVHGNNLSITPIFLVPEYSEYFVGSTLNGTVDCANVDYERYSRQPISVPIKSAKKICVYGHDLAGNKSATFEYFPPRP